MLFEMLSVKNKIVTPVFPSSQSLPVEWGVTTRDNPFFFSGTSDLLIPKKTSPLFEFWPEFKKGVFPEQVHESKVKFLFEENLRKESVPQIIPKTDGLLTSASGPTLAILTADCLPIFFFVPDPLTIGIVHAGWRGSAAAIARTAVEKLRRTTRQSPEKFLVTFGPCIGACCYEVGAEFGKLFWDSVTEREGSWYLDLVKENRHQLKKAGVREENMGEHPPCTFCHPDNFYSYRREKEKAGRMVSWIRIKNMVS